MSCVQKKRELSTLADSLQTSFLAKMKGKQALEKTNKLISG